ncbi:UNVERIFIED_CONTAM: hypothetical protein FKN15_067645 [Acipenser sinensis]
MMRLQSSNRGTFFMELMEPRANDNYLIERFYKRHEKLFSYIQGKHQNELISIMKGHTISEIAQQSDPIRVLVTGAAGQIAYSLLYNIAKGDVFGKDQPACSKQALLTLAQSKLKLFRFTEVIPTDKEEVAFKDLDAAILVGSMPRKEGMERKDLLKANVKIFKSQGAALDKYAKKTVKLAIRVGVPADNVKDVIIWGNHSSTQYPDVHHAKVKVQDKDVGAYEAVQDDNWLKGDFISTVQQRGAAVIKARKLSSAMSAAKAISDHMRDIWFGTPEGEFISMGVISDGNSYEVPSDLIYSFPVVIKNKTWKIVDGLAINDFSRGKMDATAKELVEERDSALEFIA